MKVSEKVRQPSRDRKTEKPVAKPKAQEVEREKPARRSRARRPRASTPEKRLQRTSRYHPWLKRSERKGRRKR